jgi:8-oxo-dGTP diphosphatase
MVEPKREFGERVAGATYVARPGGYAVIFNDTGEVAVVSTPQGHFLPGGGQDHGETPGQAAVREVHEECGLSIRLGPRLGTADELVFAEEEGVYYRKRCAFFLGRVVRREALGEIDHELIWLDPEEAAACLNHGSQSWAVSQACRRRFFNDDREDPTH